MFSFSNMKILNLIQTCTAANRNRTVMHKRKNWTGYMQTKRLNKEKMIYFHCVTYSVFLNGTHFIWVFHNPLQKFNAIKKNLLRNHKILKHILKKIANKDIKCYKGLKIFFFWLHSSGFHLLFLLMINFTAIAKDVHSLWRKMTFWWDGKMLFNAWKVTPN